MKKFLLSALCAVATLAASAAEFTYSIELNKKDQLPSGSTTLSGVAWTTSAAAINTDSNRGVQLFAKAKSDTPKSWSIETEAFASATITAVEVTSGTTKNGKTDISVKVGDAAFGSTQTCDATTSTPYSFTGSASGKVVITIAQQSGVEGGGYIRGIKVTYTADAEIGGGSTPDPDPVEVGEVATIAEFLANKPATDTKITEAVTVFYQSADKKYTFVTDGTTNLQIYAVKGLTNAYTNGNVLIGITGTYGEYQGMSQMVPLDSSFGTATDGTAVEPKAATLAEVVPCAYVKVTGVNIVADGSKFNVTDGTTTLQVYDRFALKNVKAAEGVTIVGIGSVYGETKQIFPVSIDYGQGGGDEPVNPGVPTEGPGSEFEPYTVAQAIALNNNGSHGWVSGYIVGTLCTTGTYHYEKEAPFTANTNIYLAETATESDTTKMVLVQLTPGKIREMVNLVDRPGNLGLPLEICGTFAIYSRQHGLKDPTDLHFTPAALPAAPEVATLTDFIEEQPTANTKITGDVTVFYQSADKKYTFITDGTSNIEVYAGAGLANAYTNGDRLTGIIGKFATYQNMPQITPQTDSFGEATAGTPVAPKTNVALADVAPADYVKISGLTITSVVDGDKTTYNVTDGTTTVQLFNRFNIEGVADAQNVTIEGIGSVYGENNQIFPIAITADGEDSIREIELNGANSVIYDLQGRRLAAPVRGINIINGHKVLVK